MSDGRKGPNLSGITEQLPQSLVKSTGDIIKGNFIMKADVFAEVNMLYGDIKIVLR